MTKHTKSFWSEVYANPPNKNSHTNKADVYQTNDTWSMDLLDLNDYGPKKQRIQICFITNRQLQQTVLDGSKKK